MGIASQDGKLWLTACNYLYQYDLSPKTAPPSNKKTILTDKNKAWNPFGMFVLEWGPDGMLYMSVGNHDIELSRARTARSSGRGESGIIMRMNPDGTKMERLVTRPARAVLLRVRSVRPALAALQRRGQPDRFVRVIEGVDYHCYSRPGVDNNWLAGKSPLAPPCDRSCTAAPTPSSCATTLPPFPQEYQGNLLLCNWGRARFRRPQPRHLPLRPRRRKQRRQEGDVRRLHRSALPPQPHSSRPRRQLADRPTGTAATTKAT